jgi:hypothetical protein
MAKKKARIKGTSKFVTVTDYGPKFNPRYWDANGKGYCENELDICGGTVTARVVKPSKLTTARPEFVPMETLVKEFLNGIDWKLLRKQKKTLIKVNTLGLEHTDAQNLEGILHLIDGLQDFAVDHGGISEKKVFNFYYK